MNSWYSNVILVRFRFFIGPSADACVVFQSHLWNRSSGQRVQCLGRQISRWECRRCLKVRSLLVAYWLLCPFAHRIWRGREGAIPVRDTGGWRRRAVWVGRFPAMQMKTAEALLLVATGERLVSDFLGLRVSFRVARWLFFELMIWMRILARELEKKNNRDLDTEKRSKFVCTTKTSKCLFLRNCSAWFNLSRNDKT